MPTKDKVLKKSILNSLIRFIDLQLSLLCCILFGTAVAILDLMSETVSFPYILLPVMFVCILAVSRLTIKSQLKSQVEQRQDSTTKPCTHSQELDHFKDKIKTALLQDTEYTRQIEGIIYDQLMFTFLDQAQKTESSIDIIGNYVSSLNSLLQKEDTITSELSRAVELLSECNVKLDNNAKEVLEISERFAGLKNESANLKEGSSNILGLLDYITSIARDTQLLSLNASIEAAKSDSSGKGFAVIAEEIKKLSDSTKSSVDSIRNTLEGFINSLDLVIEQIDQQFSSITTKAQEYKEMTANAKHTIEQVRSIADSVFEIKDEISKEIDRSKIVYGKISSLSENFDTMSEITDKIIEKNTLIQNNLIEVAEIINSKENSIQKDAG